MDIHDLPKYRAKDYCQEENCNHIIFLNLKVSPNVETIIL